MFRYHDIRASSYCNLPKLFCYSDSIINIQNIANYCFLLSILAHKYKVDNRRERVSNYAKHFHELNRSDLQFPMKIKDISAFEQLNKPNINVFELSSNEKTLSPKYINKNYYKEQRDLLLYDNHYCLITNFRNFVEIMNTLNIYAEDV